MSDMKRGKAREKQSRRRAQQKKNKARDPLGFRSMSHGQHTAPREQEDCSSFVMDDIVID